MPEATITDNSYQVTSAGPNPKPWNKSRRKIRPFFCNIMDIVLFLLHIRGLKPLLVFYFRVEEKFAGGKFRGRKISRNSIRSGYYFRGRKISRKIKIRENSENLLHAKNWCYTVLFFTFLLVTIILLSSLPIVFVANPSRFAMLMGCVYVE